MQTNIIESRLMLDQEWRRANNKGQKTLVRVKATLPSLWWWFHRYIHMLKLIKCIVSYMHLICQLYLNKAGGFFKELYLSEIYRQVHKSIFPVLHARLYILVCIFLFSVNICRHFYVLAEMVYLIFVHSKDVPWLMAM